MNKALADMPKEYVIKPFLDAHKMEVSGMLLTEYNEAETMEMFKKDGEKIGENRLAKLIRKLFELGRIDDAQKAASDQAFRNLLFQEFHI